MSINILARRCLAQFKSLEASAKEQAGFVDEHGRYRTWTGNISAHRTGHRSLEYQLRDSSNLQSTVTSLLEDLLQGLNTYAELVARQSRGSGEDETQKLHSHASSNYGPASTSSNFRKIKQMRTTEACEHCRQRKQQCDEGHPCSFCKEDNLSCQYRDTPPVKTDQNMEKLPAYMDRRMHDPDEENDATLFGTAENTDNTSPGDQALEEIHEINTCLLRFSMALRNPARHDQMKQADATSTSHFEPYDIEHVRQKFPNAKPYLHERLGKSISRHRQYYKYREEHHSKLGEGLDDDKADQEERPSTIATSLHNPPSTPMANELGDETASMYSATSFAPTAAGDKALRLPLVPATGQDGKPFECPVCYRIVAVDDERSWR